MRHANSPASSKIASMASKFQEVRDPAPTLGKKPDMVPIATTRHSFPGNYKTPAPTGLGTAEKKVKVHRTESHHERFNSARALFERIGSGDNLLEDATKGSSRVTSPSGSRTSSISHRPESRSEDSESGLLRSRSSSPLSFSPSRSSSVSSQSTTDVSFRNGTNGDTNVVANNQNGTATRNGTSNSTAPPDKPERKINAKEAISKHRNWFSNFEKSKSPGDSVDTPRRLSVNKENKPSYIAGSKTPNTTTPLSPNHQPRTVTPPRSVGDSIETYMQNWRKTPGTAETSKISRMVQLHKEASTE